MLNNYILWDKAPNTICEGARVYTKTFTFDTNNEFKDRLVRVYLPSTYDFSNPNHRFRTIYMFDGKNLFDDYTSFVGEWGIDETIEDFIENKESEGYIVIGIDAPKTDIARSLEMSPDELTGKPFYRMKVGNEYYASKLAKFVVEELKKDIDETFFTKPEREYTGVGGSSMGGIMAFYMGIRYPQVFKYCLNFSPAFSLFTWTSFKKMLDGHINKNLPKQFFYVGGVGFEHAFIHSTIKTYKYFLKHNYSEKDVCFVFDKEKEHNEKAWREYFPQAIKMMDF